MTTGVAGATAERSGADEPGDPPGWDPAPGERRLSDWIDRVIDGRWRAAEVTLYVVAAVAAWLVRFVQDDAFITYRYARNLARGEGLVFNPGERVEGYTNFLWTVLHALPEWAGWSTPVFSQLVGIALMVATVAVTLRLARRVFGSEAFAFLVVLVLLANMTFLTYATGGLETMQQALLVVSVAALLLPVPNGARGAVVARQVGAGVCAGLAVLTRMDSAVLVGTLIVVALVVEWRRSTRPERRTLDLVRSAALIGVPGALIVAPWLIWKLAYYGNLLPNTFYAKSAGNPIVPPLYGLFYLLVFFVSYAAFLLIGRWRRYRCELFGVHGMAQLLAVVPVWFFYICVVGGDFMEFRFMVPIMFVLAMTAAFLLDRFTNRRAQAVLLVVLLLFSFSHRVMPTIIPYPVLTFRELSHWPNDSTTTWKGRGEFLAEQFPGGPDVDGQPTIAIAPLGVLPYFADLPTVDMLGLTDPVTAREGYSIEPYYPGHVRMARPEHLVDRGVNLVLAQPGTTDPVDGREAYRVSELTFLYPSVDLNDLPDDAQVIEIPQVNERVWLIIYLQQNDLVDEAIAANGWDVVPIEKTCVISDMDVVGEDELLSGLANYVSRLIGERTCPQP